MISSNIHNIVQLHRAALLIGLILLLCSCCTQKFVLIDYSPEGNGDWRTATPEKVGLEREYIEQLYSNAAHLKSIYGLLVIKDNCLIAEHYFHGSSAQRQERLQSVTKSFTSALVGIAVSKGLIKSVDRKMMDYFPEFKHNISDPRKKKITIRQLLEMRAGYPWEESSGKLIKVLYGGFRTSNIADIPLNKNPGSGFDYSNLSSHILAIITARAAGTDLLSFAREHLFNPLGINEVSWIKDWDGNYNGHADMFLTAREMAKFGQLYLDNGNYKGEQLIPERWVENSLKSYTPNAWRYAAIGPHYKNNGYGYQWWSAYAGNRRFNFAWGHGGQQITLVKDYNMVIVVTADPLHKKSGSGSWDLEKSNLNLVANFIESLPQMTKGASNEENN